VRAPGGGEHGVWEVAVRAPASPVLPLVRSPGAYTGVASRSALGRAS
jgi:hypothetical protein